MLGHYGVGSRDYTPGPGHYQYKDQSKMGLSLRSSVISSRKGKTKDQSLKDSIERRIPKPRDCSFAVPHSGEPYTPFGAIDKSPKFNPPLSY
jgi:hypothetical protein